MKKSKTFIPSPRQAEKYTKKTLAKYVRRLAKKLNADLLAFERQGKTTAPAYVNVVNELQSLNNTIGKRGRRDRAGATTTDIYTMRKTLEIIFNYFRGRKKTPTMTKVVNDQNIPTVAVIRNISDSELREIMTEFFSVFGSRDGGGGVPYYLLDSGAIVRNAKGQYVSGGVLTNTELANELARHLQMKLGGEITENAEQFLREFTLSDEIHNRIQSILYPEFDDLLKEEF